MRITRDRYKTKDATVSLVVSKTHFNLLSVQLVITEELDSDNFEWLSALTDKLTEESRIKRRSRVFVHSWWRKAASRQETKFPGKQKK